MATSKILIFLVVVAVASAKVTRFHKCSGVNRGRCEVSEVRITPCLNNNCKVIRNENVTISFDFTPNFSATTLKTNIYNNNIAFPDMNTNACELTSCPTVSGSSQTFSYALYIGSKIPQGKYTISFKVWNEEDENDICCFETKVSVPK